MDSINLLISFSSKPDFLTHLAILLIFINDIFKFKKRLKKYNK